MKLSKGSRIVVIGAGPAGLSTAYYLRERGYTNVLVLEREPRVGGLCKSLTVGGESFDLGANFVTKAYTELMAVAKKLGMKMYSEKPFAVMDAPLDATKPVRYDSLFRYVRERPEGTIPLPHFTWAVFRYMKLRWDLRHLIDKPDFSGVSKHPELCVPFDDWLRAQPVLDRDLHYYLAPLFQVPITMMGYGQLGKTAAPYGLKFMTLATFWPMVLKSIPVLGPWLTAYPKRFELGFQRLWERLSWELDVRLAIDVVSIERPDEGPIRVRFQQVDQDLADERTETDEIIADAVVLACPLRLPVLDRFLDLKPDEAELFERVAYYDYCMTTRQIRDLGAGLDQAMRASAPLLCVFPEDDSTLDRPWAIAQAREDSDFVQFYTRCDPAPGTPFEEVRQSVFDGVDALLAQMRIGADRPNQPRPLDDSWHTFDRWMYFQHVESTDFADGWYDRLTALQGRHRTFYVGGVTNFELIEPIMEHSKGLVIQHFPGDSLGPSFPWRSVLAALIGLVLLAALVFLPLKRVPLPEPISDRTPEAHAASVRFWDVFHGQRYDEIGGLLEDLDAAYRGDPEDPILTSLIGAAHLWRFQERRRTNTPAMELRSDLPKGIWYAEETLRLEPRDSHDVPSTFAPAIMAMAHWHEARLGHDANLLAATQRDVLQSTQEVPQFDGFVQGWLASTFLAVDDPRYVQAQLGYSQLLRACAGFSPPAKMPFNRFVLSYLSLKSVLQPELAVCYANPIAPHNLEGYFLAVGDFQVKSGQFDLAKLSYSNAKTMPTYATWPFQSLLEERLASDLPTLQKQFQSQTDLIDIPPGVPAMSLQSGIGCASCHASGSQKK
ncbi:MAG: FAD-dependent oxidoreductase [Myxococcota bacterium]